MSSYLLDDLMNMDFLMDGFGVYRSQRNVPELADNKAQGRNEKCACGSGLKFKKCCGKPMSAEEKRSQKPTSE